MKKIKFDYESINDFLYNVHPNLSCYWTSIGWDEEKASIDYDFEDGSFETLYIYKNGKYEASDKLIREMESID